MISKDLLLRLTPRERKERRQEQHADLWNKLHVVHSYSSKNWQKKRSKCHTEEIPSKYLKEYRKMFNAIDTNNDGLLQFSEIVDAFMFSGYDILEDQLRKEMRIRSSDIQHIEFDTFARWFHQYIQKDHEMYNTLQLSISRFHRQNQINSIRLELFSRDCRQQKLNNQSRFHFAAKAVKAQVHSINRVRRSRDDDEIRGSIQKLLQRNITLTESCSERQPR